MQRENNELGCLVMKTLVIVIPSTGTYPGIWSRSLCINEGLMKGTMLPFFHRAMQEDMGIIVLNPNVNSYYDEKTSERKPIPYNDTPEKHVLYVWDRIISFTTAKDILIIAYGEGGNHTKALIQAREGTILSKLRAVAFTQSQHTLSSDLSFGLSRVDRKPLAISWKITHSTGLRLIYQVEIEIMYDFERVLIVRSKKSSWVVFV